MNNLEITFQKIMREYGHDVLVVHNDINEICSCYDPVTSSPSRNCPYCFGTGKVSQIKKYRTRYVDASVPESNVFLNTPQDYGPISVGAKTYFFYKDKKLKVGDLIVEVEWDSSKPLYNDDAIYEISHIEKIRYLNGKVVYYRAYVKEQPINKEIRGIQIVSRAGDVQYQLAEGEPYQIKDPWAKQEPVRRVENKNQLGGDRYET